MKTKIEILVDRLIMLTDGGYLNWEPHGYLHQKVDSYNCKTKDGTIIWVLSVDKDPSLRIDVGGGRISFKPPNLKSLCGCIHDEVELSDFWEAQEFIQHIMEVDPDNEDI